MPSIAMNSQATAAPGLAGAAGPRGPWAPPAQHAALALHGGARPRAAGLLQERAAPPAAGRGRGRLRVGCRPSLTERPPRPTRLRPACCGCSLRRGPTSTASSPSAASSGWAWRRPARLKRHLSSCGPAKQVLMAHSTVHARGEQPLYPRRRPSSLGFVHMVTPAGARRALALGEGQTVDNCAVSVQRFERRQKETLQAGRRGRPRGAGPGRRRGLSPSASQPVRAPGHERQLGAPAERPVHQGPLCHGRPLRAWAPAARARLRYIGGLAARWRILLNECGRLCDHVAAIGCSNAWAFGCTVRTSTPLCSDERKVCTSDSQRALGRSTPGTARSASGCNVLLRVEQFLAQAKTS
ncbi:unnamed protein product [Prorocentrum cordatum]|uniref:Uncharacterized protein n=1 Tax=Prorocentrum cordatum TaxID=2364126 RepID=A0ABN9W638_9DINO|nr:unnamed protein product [Polarella glacialis]